MQEAIYTYDSLFLDSGGPPIKVTLRSVGPAITLMLTYFDWTFKKYGPKEGKHISVDLVIATNFEYNAKFPTSRINNLQTVAKICKHQEDKPHSTPYPDPHLLWRISFSKQEHELIQCLHNKSDGCTSFILRFYKALQREDGERLPNSEFTSSLSSYILKTVLFHVCLPFDNTKWSWSKLPERLTEFTHALIDALDKRYLSSAFFNNPNLGPIFPKMDFYLREQKNNLLGGMPSSTLSSVRRAIHNCLQCHNLDWMTFGLAQESSNFSQGGDFYVPSELCHINYEYLPTSMYSEATGIERIVETDTERKYTVEKGPEDLRKQIRELEERERKFVAHTQHVEATFCDTEEQHKQIWANIEQEKQQLAIRERSLRVDKTDLEQNKQYVVSREYSLSLELDRLEQSMKERLREIDTARRDKEYTEDLLRSARYQNEDLQQENNKIQHEASYECKRIEQERQEYGQMCCSFCSLFSYVLLYVLYQHV